MTSARASQNVCEFKKKLPDFVPNQNWKIFIFNHGRVPDAIGDLTALYWPLALLLSVGVNMTYRLKIK